jgi:hypothetical protein
VRADAHNRLVLPNGAPTGNHDHWEEASRLQAAFEPMIKRIRYLAGHVLLSKMVLSVFLSCCIAPLQSRIHPVWHFTGEGDTTQLEHDRGSDLALDTLRTLLEKLSPDPSSTNFVTPSLVCAPLYSDQEMWMRLVRELPPYATSTLPCCKRADPQGRCSRWSGWHEHQLRLKQWEWQSGGAMRCGQMMTNPFKGGRGCSTVMGSPSAGPHQQGSRS